MLTKLPMQRLLIGGVEVNPYEYFEEDREGILNIDGKAHLTVEQWKELESLQRTNDYFPVQRIGIDNEPILMRFGINYWSLDDDGYKQELTLVSKAWDEEQQRNEPTRQSMLRWVNTIGLQFAQVKVQHTKLLELLKSKGLLTDNELAEIMLEADGPQRDIQQTFFKVADIDTRR